MNVSMNFGKAKTSEIIADDDYQFEVEAEEEQELNGTSTDLRRQAL